MIVDINNIRIYPLNAFSSDFTPYLPEPERFQLIKSSELPDNLLILYIKKRDFYEFLTTHVPNFSSTSSTNINSVFNKIDDDEYIVIHLQGVPLDAVRYFESNDFEKLYDMYSYNQNVNCYYDERSKSIVYSNNSTCSESFKKSGRYLSLSIYAEVLAKVIAKDFIDTFGVLEDTDIKSGGGSFDKYHQKLACSYLSFYLESLLQTYHFLAFMDYVRDPEVYTLFEFIIPNQYNYSSEWNHPTQGFSCLGDIDEFLYRTDSYDPDKGFSSYIFFRIARHFDKPYNNNLSRHTRTSYVFDSNISYFNSTLKDKYVLEVYYDSYYGFVRDHKSYPHLLFFEEGRSSNTLSLSSISGSDVIIYNEGHIFKTSPTDNIVRETDDFLITSRNKNNSSYGEFVLFSDYQSYNSIYSNIKGYAPINKTIKDWIYFYHDYTPGDLKDKKKFCFFFLVKRYKLKLDSNDFPALSRDSDGIYDYEQLFSNTHNFIYFKYLSHLIRFLALIKMGFKIFLHAQEVVVNTGNEEMNNVSYKSYKDNPNNPNQMDRTDLFNYYTYVSKDKMMMYYMRFTDTGKHKDRIFLNYGSSNLEVDCINEVDFIYQMYYNNPRMYIKRFSHDMSMDEFGDIISCGNLLYLLRLNKRQYLCDSEISIRYSRIGSTLPAYSIQLSDLFTERKFFGGILFFLTDDLSDDIKLPFLYVHSIEEMIEKMTNEPTPILYTNDPRELDRRLYAYDVPSYISYTDPGDVSINIVPDIYMRTYTDRHKSITLKDIKKKTFAIKNGMFVNHDKNFKYNYYTETKDDNNVTLYHYYEFDPASNNYKAIKDLKEIFDRKLYELPEIRDKYFTLSTTTVDDMFFMDNIFYHVITNINNIMIPVLYTKYTISNNYGFENNDLVFSGMIYNYPSIYQRINEGSLKRLSNSSLLVRGDTPVNDVPEYDPKTGLYFREFLYNKYLRHLIIFANKSIYRSLFYTESEKISISQPDMTIEGDVEILTFKELDDDKKSLVMSYLGSYINDKTLIRVANVTINISTITSGIIGQTHIYIGVY